MVAAPALAVAVALAVVVAGAGCIAIVTLGAVSLPSMALCCRSWTRSVFALVREICESAAASFTLTERSSGLLAESQIVKNSYQKTFIRIFIKFFQLGREA